MVPGFEPTTSQTWVITHNPSTRAPAHDHIILRLYPGSYVLFSPRSSKGGERMKWPLSTLPYVINVKLLDEITYHFKKMGQSRPLFVYFRHFLITISIIQIEKSVVGVLRIRTWGRRMVGADETMELWRPPCNIPFMYSTLSLIFKVLTQDKDHLIIVNSFWEGNTGLCSQSFKHAKA